MKPKRLFPERRNVPWTDRTGRFARSNALPCRCPRACGLDCDRGEFWLARRAAIMEAIISLDFGRTPPRCDFGGDAAAVGLALAQAVSIRRILGVSVLA